MSDRIARARAVYEAWAAGDGEAIEQLLADDLTFSSPADVGLDRAGYFERCWPHSGSQHSFAFERLFEVGDEVVVTYEAQRGDGSRFRNTEILGFDDADRVRTVEVYFGWNL